MTCKQDRRPPQKKQALQLIPAGIQCTDCGCRAYVLNREADRLNYSGGLITKGELICLSCFAKRGGALLA